jgi:hypothetical protein
LSWIHWQFRSRIDRLQFHPRLVVVVLLTRRLVELHQPLHGLGQEDLGWRRNRLSASNRSLRSAGLSTDGQRVLVVYYGETRVSPVDLLDTAKQRKQRDLTRAKRDQFELEVPAKP